jgi:DNA-binding response OmpR family regulator
MAQVLLMEADQEIRDQLVPALERLGHNVTVFAEGATDWKGEVLDADFDLYVLGGGPHDQSVLGLCSSLHIVYPARPILLLLAGQSPEKSPSDSQQALDAGATAVLTKPISQAEFENTVCELAQC